MTKEGIVKNVHSNVADHIPDSAICQEGQILVNNAAGEGKAFLSTLKEGGEIATFHEDAYWASMINGKSAKLTFQALVDDESGDFVYGDDDDDNYPFLAASSSTKEEWFAAEIRTISLIIGDEIYNLAVDFSPSTDTYVASFHYATYNSYILVNETSDGWVCHNLKNTPRTVTFDAKISNDVMAALSGRTEVQLDIDWDSEKYKSEWRDADIRILNVAVYTDSGYTSYVHTMKFMHFNKVGDDDQWYASPIVTAPTSNYIELSGAEVHSTGAHLIYIAYPISDGSLKTTAKTYTEAINELKDAIDAEEESSKPIVITFPSDKLADADTMVGNQGETTYIIEIENDDSNSFYTAIGADVTDTKATYFEKLQKSLVLLYGNVPNYIPVSYIEDSDNDRVTLTWHAHFWQDRYEAVVSNNIADCICTIEFDILKVTFAMTQYTDDEAHMSLPYRIVIDLQVAKNDDGETITTLSLKNINNESLTCSQIITWAKAGYRFIFGTLNSDGSFVAADQDYDIWFFNDNQIALRYPEIDRGTSVGSSYYYTNSYSVAVFDASGVISRNDTTDTPIKGNTYTWRPVMSASGDTYITATIAKDSLGSSNVLKIATKTKTIESATEDSDGLATAYDVKQYIESKVTATDTYELDIDDDGVVSCIKNGSDEGFEISDDGVISLA